MVIEVPAEILNQRLQELIMLWKKFMELFDRGVESNEIPMETEKEFRALQVEITRRCQFLTMAIPEKLFDLWKDIKKLLSETPSLGILKREVPIKVSALRHLWHDVSIALNQKHGQLRNLLEQRASGHHAKKGK